MMRRATKRGKRNQRPSKPRVVGSSPAWHAQPKRRKHSQKGLRKRAAAAHQATPSDSLPIPAAEEPTQAFRLSVRAFGRGGRFALEARGPGVAAAGTGATWEAAWAELGEALRPRRRRPPRAPRPPSEAPAALH